jgi:hypothetical protein
VSNDKKQRLASAYAALCSLSKAYHESRIAKHDMKISRHRLKIVEADERLYNRLKKLRNNNGR